jgi:hypothetical protein
MSKQIYSNIIFSEDLGAIPLKPSTEYIFSFSLFYKLDHLISENILFL